MNKKQVELFNEEMAYLNEAGAEFAKAYPKIAGRLKLNNQGSKDPQIALLMEAFAFLTARIQGKINDDFPELSETLLNILYPHYQAPIPAMSVAQFQPAPDLAKHFLLAKGTQLETDPAQGNMIYFQTCYDIDILPIKIETAELSKHLQFAPASTLTNSAEACLRLVFSCLDPDMSFAKLSPKKIRLFLNIASQQAFPLYELLLKNGMNIAVANHYQDSQVQWLSPQIIKSVGFQLNEGLLPYSNKSALGYRLLTEYFIFPEKFLFIDLDMTAFNFHNIGNKVEFFIYLNMFKSALQHGVKKDVFALNCAPIINLFKQTAEPIHISQQHYQHKVIPDSRRLHDLEIYSIDKVLGITQQDEEIEYLPFYNLKFGVHSQSHPAFWTASRQSTIDNEAIGSDINLSIVNLDLSPLNINQQTLYLETTCMNRFIPATLGYDNDLFTLQLSNATAPVNNIHLLITPTTMRQPLSHRGKHYALLAHLSLNQVSLVDPEQGIEYLREIMKLYSFSENEENNHIAQSLVSVKNTNIVRRLPMGVMSAFCQGLQITVEVDTSKFIGNSAYLFAKVLEQFLALFVSINSFVELKVISKQSKTEIYHGKPLAGDKILL